MRCFQTQTLTLLTEISAVIPPAKTLAGDNPGMWWESANARVKLDWALAQINSTETGTWPDEGVRCAALFDALNALLDFPNTRLAAYGTLRPGESNHAMLTEVPGIWINGMVDGVRFEANGYPAFKWRPGNGVVPVSVLTSDALPDHWARLDDFEGGDYRRILVPVRLPSGTSLVANLYQYIGPLHGGSSEHSVTPLAPRA